jgi:hypothetical protein
MTCATVKRVAFRGIRGGGGRGSREPRPSSGEAEFVPRVSSTSGETEFVPEGWSTPLSYYMSRMELADDVCVQCRMRNHGWW